MKLWVFEVKEDQTGNDSKVYLVEQLEDGLIKVKFNPVKSIVTAWAWIDELQNRGYIRYLTTVRTFKSDVSEGFYDPSVY